MPAFSLGDGKSINTNVHKHQNKTVKDIKFLNQGIKHQRESEHECSILKYQSPMYVKGHTFTKHNWMNLTKQNTDYMHGKIFNNRNMATLL